MVAEIFHLKPQWDNNLKIHEIKKIYESILNKYILILLRTGLNDKSVNRTNKHTSENGNVFFNKLTFFPLVFCQSIGAEVLSLLPWFAVLGQ